MTFDDLALISPLLKAVKQAGYTTPSPIQQKAIPPVLKGKDLLGCAQTGTGKTAAFALPILQRLCKNEQRGKNKIRCLVLTPTRELALQIKESFDLYAKHVPLKSTVIFGGVGQRPQVVALKRGVDILVATPGRLNDLIAQGYIKLGNIEIFVLDEADRMLDMGFVNDVKRVIRHLPKERQTLFFSATMPKEIVTLANSLLENPVKVFVTPPSTTVEKIEQYLYKVEKKNKKHLLANLLESPDITNALVFTRTKHGADKVVRDLKRENVTAVAIHGNKSQNARQTALAQFKNGTARVMVATDIAARGIDIQQLSHVFNYDLPNVPETYVHRIGRTGRAGNEGIAISFCCDEEQEHLDSIEKLIGFSITEKQNSSPQANDGDKKEKTIQNIKKEVKEKSLLLQESIKNKKPEQKSSREKQMENRKKPTADAKRNQKRNNKPNQNNDKNEAQGKSTAANASRRSKKPQSKNTRNQRNNAQNPYENRTGGNAIVYKRPAWSTQQDESTESNENLDTARTNTRRSKGKNRGPRQNNDGLTQKRQKDAPQQIKKNEKGIFDFSEEELAEDTSLRLISTEAPSEVKYANFEEYLKKN